MLVVMVVVVCVLLCVIDWPFGGWRLCVCVSSIRRHKTWWLFFIFLFSSRISTVNVRMICFLLIYRAYTVC